MKKIVAMIGSVLAVMGLMTSCSLGGSATYKDGTYRAEAKEFDDHGWKDYVNVTVKDGKIAAVEYDAMSQEDGRKKTEDEAYKEAYIGAGYETYPADYTEKLEKGLIEKQEGSKVDTVAGATSSSHSFKKLIKELEKSMKSGKTETLSVDTAMAEESK
ncbi:MAG: FMN-binding protein [Oscillospiraceae bacterium]